MNGYIGSALNDDLSMVSKDGYYFTRGEMDEIYEQNTFCLQVGRSAIRSCAATAIMSSCGWRRRLGMPCRTAPPC